MKVRDESEPENGSRATPPPDLKGETAEVQAVRFLASLSEALRPLIDPDQMIGQAAARLADHLGAAGCIYAEAVAGLDRLATPLVTGVSGPCFERASSASSADSPASFGEVTLDYLRRNKVFVLGDAGTDPRLSEADRETFHEHRIESMIAAPLRKDGQFAAMMAVYEPEPRQWTVEEAELLCAVAARCWESVERARALRELEQSERWLRLAQRAGRVGVFEWNLRGDHVTWSPELERLYRVEEGSFSGGFEDWCACLVPEDAERARHEVTAVISAARREFAFEFRALLEDGTTAWLACQAQISYDGSGPLRMIGVNIDIEDRKRAEQERELLLSQTLAARAEAEEANRAKSVFLANMSHELRTPINAISGYTELMALGITGPVTEKQQSHLERIRVSSDHLLTLVNEVLDLAKVESGKLTVARDPLVLHDIVRETLSILGADAGHRGVTIRNGMDEAGDIVFLGDRDRVRQILVNLVSNALKFTDEGGQVTLRASESNPEVAGAEVKGRGYWLRMDVEDTGIGVPEEELGRIFEPFVQADSGYARRSEGTGLGLSISRRLARQMGGDLTVASEEGKGSRFSLWLPLAMDDTSADSADWRPTVQGTPGLSLVGHVLTRSADEIVELFEERLRGENGMERARGLVSPQLSAHVATLLAAIGGTLTTLDEANGDSELMRDGAEVQRAIARLHGALRGRLGWTEEDIRHEFEILRVITSETLQHLLHDNRGAVLDEAIGVVTRLLEQVERDSIRGRARALRA
ncbi:MAG: PAS domain-containing protein [Gemmatimonadota bacterium]|jgi:signal transduction histidine kinase|nr:PAS domain-containing protein [Gemmatimonadota bacterium]